MASLFSSSILTDEDIPFPEIVTGTELKAGIEEVPEGFDILLRTNARKAVAEEIQKEITGAVTALKEIRGKGTQGKAFTVLMRPPEFYVSLLRDFPFAPDKVLSDIPLAAERLRRDARHLLQTARRFR